MSTTNNPASPAGTKDSSTTTPPAGAASAPAVPSWGGAPSTC